MKFNEFKKKVEELNSECIAEITNDKAAIYVMGKNDVILAKIDNKDLGIIQFQYYCTRNLSEEIRLRLLDLLYEFAKTPLDERLEEDKYYLKYVGELYYDGYIFLNHNEEDGGYFKMDNSKEIYGFKTKFTQKEIDELPEEFQLMLEHGYYKKVKVNEDEN